MKKIFFSSCINLSRVIALFLTVLFFSGTVKAQILAEWPLLKIKTGTGFAATNIAPGVSANDVVLNDSFQLKTMFGVIVPTATGLRLKQSHNWPSVASALDLHYAIDFPITPAAGNDLLITGLTFDVAAPASSGGTTPPTLSIIPYYQIDNSGNWAILANAQSFSLTAPSTVNFGKINVPFFSNSSKSGGHTYTVRLYVFSTDGAVKADLFSLANVTFLGTHQTATTAPTVTTATAVKSPTNGKYAGAVTGSYDFGTANGKTYQNPTLAGIVWSTTASPDITSSFYTTDGANGIINSAITGLKANTTYHVRAFIVTPLETIYGQELTFTTDNFTIPVDSTVAATNVVSVKATVGGVILDSGGTDITNKEVHYGTSSLSLTNVAKPINNIGSAPYTVTLEPLQPNTKYYYQACASNSVGSNCGTIQSFTTTGVVPVLSVKQNPPVINFGDIIYNTTSPIISYTITGSNLNPVSGNITITMTPAQGFIMSTSTKTFPSSPVNSITIPYSNGTINAGRGTVIYIKFPTNTYGNFYSVIGHSGGGVAAQDADSVYVSGNVIPSPDKLSNMGTDFWTGFGCEENMKSATTQFDTATGSAKGAHFSLYIASGNQDAQVMVDLPGLSGVASFPRLVTIKANSVTEVGGFPVGDGTFNNPSKPDCRLYYTGVSSKGIHITSTNGVPIACWLYDWATNNSAAGAMLFPTNTWNSSYSVQAYGGTTSNTGVVSSYFFVIANDDNTVLSITPSADIIDSASSYIANSKVKGGGTVLHPAGTTYNVILPHKGDVYNAIGLVDASSLIGYDLTGTKISTDCNKKIAVFGGNSRTLINTASCNTNTSGSDNLIQQMFPKVAWGTKYLTVPTKNMEFNTYRVSVEDASTVVKVNGSPILPSKYPVLGASFDSIGSFYEFASNQPMSITGDKPISVTQFIMPGKSCGGASVGNSGTGDPEMILLSPIQQAINNATVFCPGFKDGTSGGTYINVIIPTSGVSSFSIDGKTATSTVDTGSSSYTSAYGTSNLPLSKAFVTHKGDNTYSYATFHVSYPAPHTISSSVPFNAIAYGMSQGESWGFNAGTAINNLSSIKIAENPTGKDTSNSVVLTCKDNPVTLSIALPYLPLQVDSIVWSVPNNSNINLSGTSTTGPRTMVDPNDATRHYADTSGIIVVNGQTFYSYKCPVQYQFSDYGFYPIVATAYGKFQSDCAGTDAQKIYVQVGSDNIDFKVTKAGCTSPNVNISDSSTAMAGASIVKWIWDLGDNSPIQTYTDSLNHNPTPNPHTYPALSTYNIKLTTINNLGCFSVDTIPVNLSFGINAGFTKDNNNICPNTKISFTDTSSGNPNTWKWDFGEPNSGSLNTSTSQNPTHIYTTSGMHYITLQVFAGVCPSNVFTDSVFVSPLPKPSFTFSGVCLPGSTVFTNTSDSATGNKPYSYAWNFGEPASGVNNSATTTDGTHTYTPPVPSGGYIVKLTATNVYGCSADTSQSVTTIYAKPTAIIVPGSDICFGDSTIFIDASTATGQTINKWNWDFGDAAKDTIQNPKHKFATVNSYTVKLSILTDKGCTADTFAVVKISPIPVAGFKLPGSCLGSGSVTFTDTSSISDASLLPFKYLWSFGDPSSNANNSSTDQNAQHDYTISGVGSYTVAETVTSTNGCKATTSRIFEIAGSKPVPGFEIVGGTSLCSNLPVQLKDTSRIAIGTIKRVEIVWDAVGKPAVVEVDTLAPSNGSVSSSKIYSHNYPQLAKDNTYTVTLTAYSGTTCSDVVTKQVTVYGTPVVVFPAQTFICANASPRNITEAKENSGLSGSFTYSGAGITGISFDPTKGTLGKDTITAIYTTTNGCKDTATSFTQVLDTVDVNFSSHIINICTTDSVWLTPNSNANEFLWTELDAPNYTFKKGTKSQNVWVQPINPITTYVVVANPSHCPTTDSVTIYAAPYPQVSIVYPANNKTTICYGAETKLVASTTSPNITWTPADSLKTVNNLSTVIANPRDTTMFIVKVSDTSYCTKSVSDTVVVNVLPNFNIAIHIGSDTSTLLSIGDSLSMTAYVIDTAYKQKLNYSWSPNPYNFLTNTDTSRTVLAFVPPIPTEPVTYTATATNDSGCKATADIRIDFFRAMPDILVPTAFAPNSNIAVNRVLIPSPIGITHFKYFKVYNRSGQLVFSTNQIGEGWDGTVQGQPADPGTYIYMTDGVDFKNKSHFHSGSVVLLR